MGSVVSWGGAILKKNNILMEFVSYSYESILKSYTED